MACAAAAPYPPDTCSQVLWRALAVGICVLRYYAYLHTYVVVAVTVSLRFSRYKNLNFSIDFCGRVAIGVLSKRNHKKLKTKSVRYLPAVVGARAAHPLFFAGR